MRQPDVIFIGVYKAGTTFIRGYFSQHPQIAWSRNAQHFLQREAEVSEYRPEPSGADDAKVFVDMFEGVALGYSFSHLVNDTTWPQLGFEPGRPIREEELTCGHKDIAERIRNTVPGAKILLVLRNQIDWLRSNYIHHIFFMNSGQRTFLDFLNTLEGKCAAYAGHFDQTVSAYFDLFGRENVHVLLMEHLETVPEQTMQPLCAFLGVDYVVPQVREEAKNTGKGTGAGNAIAMLSRLGLGDNAIRSLARMAKPAHSLADRLFARDVISPQQARMLAAVYAASNSRTQRLTGLDLAGAGYPV